MTKPQPLEVRAKSVSWLELFSQHELNLNNHLKICGMVKQHVLTDSPTSRALSSMVDRTRELLRQLEDMRTEFMPQHPASKIISGKTINRVNELRAMNKNADPSAYGSLPTPSSAQGEYIPTCLSGEDAAGAPPPPFVFDKQPAQVSLPHHLKRGKRRFLDYDEMGDGDGELTVTTGPATKRKKLLSSGCGEASDWENAYAATTTRRVETEDISAEVEARLREKEERRRRRGEKREMKRKRNSSGSTFGGAGVGSSPQPGAKRSKLRSVAGQEGAVVTPPMTGYEEKTREKRRGSSGYHDASSDYRGSYDGAMHKRQRRIKLCLQHPLTRLLAARILSSFLSGPAPSTSPACFSLAAIAPESICDTDRSFPFRMPPMAMASLYTLSPNCLLPVGDVIPLLPSSFLPPPSSPRPPAMFWLSLPGLACIKGPVSRASGLSFLHLLYNIPRSFACPPQRRLRQSALSAVSGSPIALPVDY
ncbi:hypothetical protein PABG_11573 [Paracoccidioides brasiliensis Pb03]|nr:hypothetical protein PABG_11573 [Paracoccidioides brasiliensis Pb03]